MQRDRNLSPSYDPTWLKVRLERVHRTQADLARALQKDRSVVSNMIRGKRKLQVEEVPKLADFLNTTEADVLSWSGADELDEAKADATHPEKLPPERELSRLSASGMPLPENHPAFGALKGMLTLDPDYDYTQPADPDWGKVYED